MSRRFFVLLASLGLAACSRSSNEQFDLVRSFNVDWESPQLHALTWAMDTCVIWGPDPAIAGACLKRQEEARHLLDGVVTCRRSENVAYAACVHIERWANGKSQDLVRLQNLSGSNGRDEDLASLRGLARPSNPFIGALWTSDDRWLALRRGAWKELAATLTALMIIVTSIRRLRSRAQVRSAALAEADLPMPLPPPQPAMGSTTSERVLAEAAPALTPEIENTGTELVVNNREVVPELSAEEVAAIARKEAKAVARRAAAEAAQREFDQIQGLF